MRVRRQVKRHIVEEYGEIRAVVEIEAAQEILVGLAAAGVLRDDDAGHRLQDFSRTKNRTVFDFTLRPPFPAWRNRQFRQGYPPGPAPVR